jgi:hypothetical protein
MNISYSPRLVLTATWLAVVNWPLPSLAQALSADGTQTQASVESLEDTEPDPYQARKLFLEGRQLLDQGHAQEACQSLERSQQLSPALGTLLNLGLCYRYSDRLASAHEFYRRAEVMATLAGDEQRRDFAHDEAAAIAAQRATLTLRFTGGSAELPLEVELDSAQQSVEVWQRPIYVDAGEHRIAVHGAGREAWHGSVVVQNGGKYLLVIPELRPESGAPEPSSAAAPPLPPSAAAVRAQQLGPVALHDDRGTMRILAVSVGAAGIAALGVSMAFGGVALSASKRSNPYCSERDRCLAEGQALRSDAHTEAARATVIGVAGAVALVGAAAMWLLWPATADDAHQPSLALGVSDTAFSGEYRGHF